MCKNNSHFKKSCTHSQVRLTLNYKKNIKDFIMTQQPLSPHLTAYRLPMAAVISISHRIVAVGMFLFGVLFALYMVLLSNGGAHYLDPFLKGWYGATKLTGMVSILGFYCLAEIRYLIWSFGSGFSKGFVRISNWIILILSLIYTLLLINETLRLV